MEKLLFTSLLIFGLMLSRCSQQTEKTDGPSSSSSAEQKNTNEHIHDGPNQHEIDSIKSAKTKRKIERELKNKK